jgi:peroxiredoxin
MTIPNNKNMIMSEVASQGSQNELQQQSQSSVSILEPGTSAPNFTLLSAPDKSVSLSQFRGHPTILAFYPADFSPVCGDQMTLYNEILPEFQRFNAELVGVSVDGVRSFD